MGLHKRKLKRGNNVGWRTKVLSGVRLKDKVRHLKASTHLWLDGGCPPPLHLQQGGQVSYSSLKLNKLLPDQTVKDRSMRYMHVEVHA